MLPTHPYPPIALSAYRFSLAGMLRQQRDPDALAWGVPVLALAAAMLVFADTWAAMARTWAISGTFGLGMAVLPIAVWLVWRRRHRLAAMRPRPDPFGLLALGAAVVAWGGAGLTGVGIAAQYAAVAVIPAIVWASAGRRVATELAFPLGFLFFLVPAGELLHPLLREGAAWGASQALRVSGVPATRDGMHFLLPAGSWTLGDADSGLPLLLAAGMLSTVFAHLKLVRLRSRMAFVAVAVGLALAANWLRVGLIVTLGDAGDPSFSAVDTSVVDGWGSFGVLMAGAAAIGLSSHAAPAVHGRPEPEGAQHRPEGSAPIVGCLLVAALCVSLPIGGRAVSAQLGDVRWDTGFEARAAAALGDYRPGPLVVPPRFSGARGMLNGTLARTPDAEFHLAYFARQRDHDPMISAGNAVVSESDPRWRTVTRVNTTFRIGDLALPVTEWRLRSPSGERLLWSWYTVNGVSTNREDVAWLRVAGGLLTRRGDHSTVAVVGTAIDGTRPGDPVQTGGIERARARLESIAPPLATISKAAGGR